MADLPAELYHAVNNNNVIKVRELLQAGANPNETYKDDPALTFTILHLCCGKGHLEIAKILVEAGARIRSRDAWAMTPFIHSITCRFTELVEYLLTRCPDVVHVADKFDKSPLHFALETDSVEIVDLLIRYNADVNISTMNGITPLMFLCTIPDLQNRETFAKSLLRNGALVDLMDFQEKRTALQFAATRRQVEMVSILLEEGADPNTLDRAGRSPITNLLLSRIRSHQEDDVIYDDVMTIIVLLIQMGGNLNRADCEYSNPLMVATLLRATQLVKFFILNGADPNVTFALGVTPLLAAVKNKDLETVKVLVFHNSRFDIEGRISRRREDFYFNPLELAIDLAQWDMVKLFVAFGYNLSRHEYLRQTSAPDYVPIFRRSPDIYKPATLRDNPLQRQYLKKLGSEPFSLLRLTNLTVRRLLGSNFEEKLQQLPLPNPVKRDITMKDICDNI